MQSLPVTPDSPKATAPAPAEAVSGASPDWTTFEAQRRRTLLFLIFAAVYISYFLITRWVERPLFHGDWDYFGAEGPPWYEFLYRWFLTFLPVGAWVGMLFFLLTRVRFLTHRRVAMIVILLGLVYIEGDMRWFQMSRQHLTWTDLWVFFDAYSDMGVRSTDWQQIIWQFAEYFVCLFLLALLAGPEPRLCLQALRDSPIGRTYFGAVCRWIYRVPVWLRLDALGVRSLRWLDSKAAFACVVVLVMIDPLVILALDKGTDDAQTERSVVRSIADANPLRWQSLDRAWNRVVFSYSEEAKDLAAANVALRDLDSDSLAVSTQGPKLAIPKPQAPAKAYNILILQVETLNAEVFHETELPFLDEFSKKCLRLQRHFSAANSTHYGVLGLLHGNPVTFFTGRREPHRPDPYLDHFKDNGYKTRLITRGVMKHHGLGNYLPNWTEEVSEPEGDFKVIPVIHEELAKPGPRLVYSFYHATHYPYNHEDKARYQKYQPEVEYEFNYNRSNLPEWKDQIVNRYKNCLLEMDDWFRDILEKVDLSNTIVVITGDHGEEFFEEGRLGHCTSLNIHQTMTPCYVYIPGVEPADVPFITSHADILPTIADALGHDTKPDALGQSLFAPVSFRYAVVSHFEYTNCLRWAVRTQDRMTVFERDYRDHVEIVGLANWKGERQSYRSEAEAWTDQFRIIRRVEQQLQASRQ